MTLPEIHKLCARRSAAWLRLSRPHLLSDYERSELVFQVRRISRFLNGHTDDLRIRAVKGEEGLYALKRRAEVEKR